MRYTSIVVLLTSLIGCDQLSVDATLVESLQVGGSATLYRQAGADFSKPDSAAWRDAQAYSINLSLAPPVHASINLRHDASAPVVPVQFRAATDGDHYYLRLRWLDDSEDRATSRTEFADGVAVQFALGGGSSTSFMMGSPGTPVNIWYWKAGQDKPQNLAAGGFGSTTRLPTDELQVSEAYRENGEWVVVFSRPLQTSAEHQAELIAASVMLSLAVWQGDARQRDGLKHVSMGWITVN